MPKLLNIEYGFTVEPKGKTPALVHQVHGDGVVELNASFAFPAPDADGIFTPLPLTEIHVFTADCLPVLLFSKTAVAAVHAGWRGTRLGIVKKALEKFPLAEVHVILGPCIRDCCFEVKQDFIHAFEELGLPVAPYLIEREEKKFFDLPRYVVETQLSALPYDHIHQEQNHCTVCSPKGLPSYRRNKSTDPRIRAWIRRLG